MINKGKVISIKSVKNINFFSKNKNLLIISLIFIIGIITSVLLFGKTKTHFNFSDFFKFFYIARGKLSFFKTYALSLGAGLSVLVLFFVFGTSMMGIGIIPAIIFILGYFMGSFTAYLYTTYSLKGIAFNILLIIPSGLIFIIVSFFASKAAIEYAMLLSNIATKRITTGSNIIQFKNYGKIFFILSIVLAISSIIDALISKLFLGFFNF